MSEKLQIRLAMRHEGLFWNAYMAHAENMNGAVHLGSLRMTLARDPELKTAFMEFMKQALAVATKQAINVEITWPDEPQPAPESERSGHG